MRLDASAIGVNPPDDINVVIEVPIGGEPIKYEMDNAAGTLVVDRFLYTPMRYPGNYGFVPHTLSKDGDPIDVLVANTRPIVPGAVNADLPKIAQEQIQHFFEHYKDLEPGKWVKLIGWGDVEEAKQLINDAIQRDRDGER